MSLYDYDVGCPSCDYGLPHGCTCEEGPPSDDELLEAYEAMRSHPPHPCTNKVSVAIAAREAMREHRAGKPVAFSWPTRPDVTPLSHRGSSNPETRRS